MTAISQELFAEHLRMYVDNLENWLVTYRANLKHAKANTKNDGAETLWATRVASTEAQIERAKVDGPEAVRLLRRLVESSCLIPGSQTRAEILGTDTDARLDEAEAFLKGLPHAP